MSKRSGITMFAMAPPGIVLGLMIAAVVTYLMPKIYESTVVIEVKPHRNTPVETPREPEGEAPAWVTAEIEIIKSRPILEKVSRNLELPARWNLAKDEVPSNLESRLNIQSMRGSDLVSIRARHANKLDARDIALEVAMVYKEHWKAINLRHSERSLAELEKAVKEQEQRVEEYAKLLQTILVPVKPRETLKLGELDYEDAKKDLENQQALLETLKRKLLAEAIILKIPTNQIEIHDMPEIGESPVSPKVTQNLILGGMLGVLLAPLLLHLRRHLP